MCDDNKSLTWMQRTKRKDFLIIYGVIIVANALFLISYIPGIYSSYYNNLKKDDTNPWVPRVAWIIAIILSYIGLYFLWQNTNGNNIGRNLAITVLYLIATFITIAWSTALYQFHNIALATWTAFLLFVYQLIILIVIWYINPLTALFNIPAVVMYFYLFYTMIQLAILNDIPI